MPYTTITKNKTISFCFSNIGLMLGSYPMRFHFVYLILCKLLHYNVNQNRAKYLIPLLSPPHLPPFSKVFKRGNRSYN